MADINPQNKSSTNKTSLKSVFVGDEDQLAILHNLVEVMNRLTIHATHFMKYHLLRRPETEITNLKCKAIICALNNSRSNQAGLAEFSDTLTEYKAAIDYQEPNLRYITQCGAYHGNAICSQYLNNIQEHFVQKVKAYCTEMIVKRLRDQVPEELTR